MSQAKKKRRPEKLSSYARASTMADTLLEAVFSEESLNLEEPVRIGRHTKRLGDLKAELYAARARVEALFAQPSMEAHAIRRRVNSDSPEHKEQPFSGMAGARE